MKTFSDIWWVLVLMAIGSYLIGSINFSIMISKMKGRDIRGVGSGNPGMMNMSRNFGLKIGVLILFLDMLKGVIPTVVGWVVFRNVTLGESTFVLSDLTKYFCGFFAVLGHIFPIYLKFKGGKGISTTIGVFVVAYPLVGVCSGLCGLAFILITSMGSMGSLIAITPPAIAAETLLYNRYIYNSVSGYMKPDSPDVRAAFVIAIVCILGICLLAWFAHSRNIERLINGEEHETSWSEMIKKMKKKKRAERLEKKARAAENNGAGKTE
ncbi:MAG: glycerol-3-phosphate acyltransferase [Clostridia bacterium]|nr:glycerol-3-phosphate acyltransferase [Clostridia bacterium]